MQIMKLDSYIELFFFDPKKSREEYIESYKALLSERYATEGVYRYSPLFLLLKDINYCFAYGKEFNPVRSSIRPPETAGIILIDVAFRNIVKRIYEKDFDSFGKKYMGIKGEENLKGLRNLRNALEHSFYGLSTYDKETKKKIYFQLSYESQAIEKLPYKNEPATVLFSVNPRKVFTAFMEGVRLFKTDLLKPNNSRRKSFKEFINVDEWIFVN